MSGTTLVIGASGRVGGEVVRLLLEKGEKVRAAARDPLSRRFPDLVEVVKFDFDRPESFASALKGVHKVFLVARPGDNQSDRAAMPLIDEAKKQDIRLIVNLTAMGVDEDETFMLRLLEKYLEASGIPFVHLRPNWFMQNFDSGPMSADIRSTGAIHLPAGDAKLSFIDARDVAAVACAALTHPRHTGNAYTLTGAEALSHFEAVERISKAAGKTISYVPITEEAARAGLSARGVPSGYIERWADFFSKVSRGLCSPISGDLESVLGRSPILFDQYAEDYADSWR